MTLSTFANANTSGKDPKPVAAEVVANPTPNVQVVKAQAGIPQTIQRVESPPIPKSWNATIEEASRVTVSTLGSGLPAFLARFDSLEFNSLPASHFHRFKPSFGSFLFFSMPVKGLPLLEGLFKAHRDSTSGFRGGIFLGNILMELLCAVLVSLRDSSLNSLSEERLLEWRGVV